MDRRILHMIIFIGFWMILAEMINVERVLVGMFVCAGVYYFNKGLIFSNKGKGFHSFKKIYGLIMYLFTLIKEVVIANFQVAKIVLSPNMNISPQTIKFETKLKTDFYRTILANSITLTPGTLTIFMEGNQFTVHCLTKDYIEDVLNSKFERILLKIEE